MAETTESQELLLSSSHAESADEGGFLILEGQSRPASGTESEILQIYDSLRTMKSTMETLTERCESQERLISELSSSRPSSEDVKRTVAEAVKTELSSLSSPLPSPPSPPSTPQHADQSTITESGIVAAVKAEPVVEALDATPVEAETPAPQSQGERAMAKPTTTVTRRHVGLWGGCTEVPPTAPSSGATSGAFPWATELDTPQAKLLAAVMIALVVLTVSVGYTAYRVHAQSAQLHAFHTHWGRAYEDLDARLQQQQQQMQQMMQAAPPTAPAAEAPSAEPTTPPPPPPPIYDDDDPFAEAAERALLDAALGEQRAQLQALQEQLSRVTGELAQTQRLLEESEDKLTTLRQLSDDQYVQMDALEAQLHAAQLQHETCRQELRAQQVENDIDEDDDHGDLVVDQKCRTIMGVRICDLVQPVRKLLCHRHR